MKKKRIFLGLGLLSAFTFSLASCVKSNITSKPDDSTTTPAESSQTTTPVATTTPSGTTTITVDPTSIPTSVDPTTTPTSVEPTTTPVVPTTSTPTETSTPTSTTTQQAVEQFAVTFHYNNGQADVTQNINDGSTVSKPQDPSKAATAQYTFTFVNWYKESNFQTVYDFSSPVTEELNLYAKFDEVVRTYTYNFVNGTDTVKTETINYGEDIVAPTTNPEKQGDLTYSYVFDGWYTAPTGGTKVTSFGTIEGNVTYYARFNQVENKYTIIWENEDGTELTTQNNVSYNSTYPGTEPTKANSTPGHIYILSWDEEIVNTTITRRAVFTDALDSFTVTWQDENGNTIETDENLTYNSDFEFNGTLPSKTGYVFAYWTQDGTTKFDITTNKVTGNITLRAVYLESYSVGFGGSYTAWTTLRAEAGVTGTTAFGTTVELNGFKFIGNNQKLASDTLYNSQGATIEVTLTGEANELHMTATSGSGTDSVLTVTYNSTVIFTKNVAKSTGNANLDLVGLPAGKYIITMPKVDNSGNASLKITTIYYSVSKEYIDITFDEMGGIDVQNVKVVKSTAVGNLPTPTRSGYRFEGWYTSNDNGVTLDTLVTSSTTFDSNVTLYAMWYELQPTDLATVSFAFNNANASLSSIQVEKGTAISEQVAPELAGYRFDGWYTTSGYNTPFNFSTVINDATTIYGKYVQQFTVTYKDQDDNVIITKTVDIDTAFGNIDQVMAPGISGKIFDGWVFEGSTTKIVSTDDITANTVLVATYRDITSQDKKIEYVNQEGMQEAAYLVVNNYKDAEGYSLYSVDSSNNLTKLIEKDYYVTPGTTTSRIDIFGLTAGTHKFLVAPVLGGTDAITLGEQTNNLVVEAYDRSGYAHFNYTDGVGAYKDNGQLKENAIVLYVTDENKNTVTLSYGGKTVTGIGNILNSVGKSCGEAGHENDCKKVDDGKTYYAKGNTNQGILADLAANNIPLVIRFVGIISETGLYAPGTYDATDAGLIDGLTEYAKKGSLSDNGGFADYGGTAGDNGHMARMKSAKNVTIEGVGDNAGLDGWGIHFMCESANSSYGKSFEVRNLVFMNTPEDAIGMEGVQSGSVITASVERCWVHHNTFLAPKISNAADSDKSEGDGSCDFKRGQYFTMSYNYYEYCHKTNLVGSSDSSLQFNLSYHHNVWYNCGSRIPLLRQANIHFYNNYIYGDSSDSASALSYVTDLRANSYMYSENNYYEGCKNPVSGTGGAAKLYGNTFIQCFGDQTGVIVDSREQTVNSNCTYNGQSLANFDTNSTLFYYDSTNKQSNCYLTDATTARNECILGSGSRYRTVLNQTTLTTETAFNIENPTNAVNMGNISLPTSKTNGVYDNVVWTGLTGYTSGETKFRGKAATFKLDSYATMTIQMTGSSSQALSDGAVVKSDGTVVITGSGVAVLSPGIYTIISCQKDKDSSITSLSFAAYDSSEFNNVLKEEFNNAVANIPSTIQYNDTCYNAINNAIEAYNAIPANVKSEVDYSPVESAYNSYKLLGQTYVENLISAIGAVNENSGPTITAARTAYTQLLSRCSDALVSNYATLQSAENTFKSYAVNACINAINAIGTVEYTNECLEKIVYAESLYHSLDDDDRTSVTNYSTLTQARATYNILESVANVNEMIASANSLTSYAEAKEAYDALSSSEKASVTGYTEMMINYTIAAIDDIGTVTATSGTKISLARSLYDSLDSTSKTSVTNYSTLTSAETTYEEFAASVIKWSADGKYTSSEVTAVGVVDASKTFGSDSYTKAVKMDSTGKITIVITKSMKLTVYQDNNTSIKVDGTKISVSELVNYELSAGTHTLEKGDKGSGNAYIFAVELN